MENSIEIKSASMLVTNDGYCIKVMFFDRNPIVSFVNKEMKHQTWKATMNNPDLILDQREFWRMRREWKLEEISLNEEQLASAIELAGKIIEDPYYGYPEDWRRKTKTTLYDLKRRGGAEVAVRYIDEGSEPATLGKLSIFQKLKEKLD